MSGAVQGGSAGGRGAFLPVPVGRVEAVGLRALLAAVVLWSVWREPRHNWMDAPAGIAALGVDLSFLGNDGVHPWFLAGTALAGVVYVAGVFAGIAATIAGLAVLTANHVAYWTLFNSQGNTFHGSQMTSLVLLLQLAAAVIAAIRRARGLPPSPRWPALDGLLLYFSQCAIAAVYVVSAITKLSKSGGRWLLDSHYFAKSIQKVWRQQYYDSPAAGTFDGISPWAEWLASHPVQARLLFAPGFFLELFAFLILWNRRWSMAFGAGLIVMHAAIGRIMQLHFPEFEALVAIFCLNIPFVIACLAARLRAKAAAALPS